MSGLIGLVAGTVLAFALSTLLALLVTTHDVGDDVNDWWIIPATYFGVIFTVVLAPLGAYVGARFFSPSRREGNVTG